MSETKIWQIQILAEGITIDPFTVTTSETGNKVEIHKGNFRVQATIKNTGSTACITAGLLDYQGNVVNGSWMSAVPVATNETTTFDRTFKYNNGSAAGDLPVGSLIPTANRLYTFQVRVSNACYAGSSICLLSGHQECDPFIGYPLWTKFNGSSFTINAHGTIGNIGTFTPVTTAVQPGVSVKIADIIVKNNGNDTGVVSYKVYQNPGESNESVLIPDGGATLASGASSTSIPLNATSPSSGPWKLGLKVYGQSEPEPAWGSLGTYIWEQGSFGENDLFMGFVILAGLAGGAFLLNKYVLSKH